MKYLIYGLVLTSMTAAVPSAFGMETLYITTENPDITESSENPEPTTNTQLIAITPETEEPPVNIQLKIIIKRTAQGSFAIPEHLKPSQLLKGLMKVSHSIAEDAVKLAHITADAEGIIQHAEKLSEDLEQDFSLLANGELSSAKGQAAIHETMLELEKVEEQAMTTIKDVFNCVMEARNQVLELQKFADCSHQR